MNLEITVSSNSKDATDLVRWLEAEDSVVLKDLRQSSNPANEGEMGSELLPILTAVLVSPLLVELVKSIFGWLSATRHESPIKVTVDGRSVEFTASNKELVNEIVATLTKKKND